MDGRPDDVLLIERLTRQVEQLQQVQQDLTRRLDRPARMRRWALTVTGLLAAYALVGGVAAAGGTNSTPSVYVAMAPAALTTTTLHSGTHTALTVAGVDGVPSTATSVQLSVTALSGTSDGYLYVYAAGDSQPASGNVRWDTGQTVTVPLTVGVGTGSQVDLVDGPGAVEIKVSVVGYYVADGAGGPAGGVLTGTYPNPGLAAAAVTPADIAKSATNGQVLTSTLLGTKWANPAPTFYSTVVVHATSDSQTNGTALLDAVDAIRSTAGTLVLVEPGSYDLGQSVLELPPDTWLQGSGTAVTTISGQGGSEQYPAVIMSTGVDTGLSTVTVAGSEESGVEMVCPNCSLQVDDVAVQVGSDYEAVDVENGQFAMQDSTVSAVATSGRTVALHDNGAAVALDDDRLLASSPDATGIDDSAGTVEGQGLSVSVTDGVAVNSDTSSLLTFDDSRIVSTGGGYAVDGQAIDIGASLVGGLIAGSVVCAADYSAMYAPLNSSCQ